MKKAKFNGILSSNQSTDVIRSYIQSIQKELDSIDDKSTELKEKLDQSQLQYMFSRIQDTASKHTKQADTRTKVQKLADRLLSRYDIESTVYKKTIVLKEPNAQIYNDRMYRTAVTTMYMAIRYIRHEKNINCTVDYDKGTITIQE